MNTLKYISALVALCFCCSCSDWLDVKPRTQKEKDDFYSTETGFKSGLTGCYMKMKQRALYGEQLTMTYIELPAQLWIPQDDPQKQLAGFQWTTTYTEGYLRTWYSQLYNVIAQANDLLDYVETQGSAIKSERLRNMIKGEALAIRAFCHFDILRLFGQLPQHATITRKLPYSDRMGSLQVPFLDFDAYREKVLRDYADAAALLKESDPVMLYSFDQLNDAEECIREGYIDNDFEAYRRIRFNYWGVKALQARAYLYFGDKEEAYNCAMEVINAKLPDDSKVIGFSCNDDFSKGYYVIPNEVLIGMNIFDMGDYVPTLFTSERGNIYYKFKEQSQCLSYLFNGQAGDYRYSNLWFDLANSTNSRLTIKKYWQSSTLGGDSSEEFDVNHQLVPLIRLPEVYFIAVETAPNMEEAMSLFEAFKTSRGRNIEDDIENELLEDELLNEYRRELIGEGQMFFTYKRLGKTSMWNINDAGQEYEHAVNEANYLLPIPNTEIEY